jgi:hypothetical protein
MYLPWTNRKFGVELEMNEVKVDNTTLTVPELQQAIREGLRAAGLPLSRCSRRTASYRHSDGSEWEVKTDASCGHHTLTGWEVASPAMTLDDDGECKELREVATRIEALRPRVDRKCGLHVHIEVRDFDWRDLRSLMILWARYEPFLFELCPPSRRVNDYCSPWRKAEWGGRDGGFWSRIEDGLETTDERSFRSVFTGGTNASGVSPRGSLNLKHFWSHGRLEFRLGAGTVNYEKIVRWTQFLLSFVTRVKQANMPAPVAGGWSDRPIQPEYLFKMLGLLPSKFVPADQISPAAGKLLDWVTKRRAQFKASTDDADAVTRAVSAGHAADGTRRRRPL